jgi:hypothetical protein
VEMVVELCVEGGCYGYAEEEGDTESMSSVAEDGKRRSPAKKCDTKVGNKLDTESTRSGLCSSPPPLKQFAFLAALMEPGDDSNGPAPRFGGKIVPGWKPAGVKFGQRYELRRRDRQDSVMNETVPTKVTKMTRAQAKKVKGGGL